VFIGCIYIDELSVYRIGVCQENINTFREYPVFREFNEVQRDIFDTLSLLRFEFVSLSCVVDPNALAAGLALFQILVPPWTFEILERRLEVSLCV
jgi:hypothetical protein